MEKTNGMSRVCTVKFATLHWFVVRRSIYQAMDTGRVRVIRIDERWYISVADLNRIYGDNAPLDVTYLYVKTDGLKTLCDYAPKKRGRHANTQLAHSMSHK